MSSQILKAASAANTYNIDNVEDGTLNITKGETSPTTVLGLSTNGITSFGGQLKFPATQNASSDVNTLDDYEEGTFTPSISFSGAAVGVTYNRQDGLYTKIGNLVTVQIFVELTNKGSSSGDLRIGGLPFTVSSLSGGWGGAGTCQVSWSTTATFVSVMGLVVANQTYINIHGAKVAATSAAAVTNSDLGNTSYFGLTATYRVA